MWIYISKLVKVLAIFSLIVFSNGNILNNSECSSLKIRNPVDKDLDILLFQNVDRDGYHFTKICRFRNGESNASLVAKPRETFDNHYVYDYRSQTLYQNSVDTIRKIALKDGRDDEIYHFRHMHDYIRSSAFDWVTNYLYVGDENKIRLIDLKNISRFPKVMLNNRDKNEISKIRNVFPNHGVLIITETPGKLIRYDTLVSDPLVLYNNSNTYIGVTVADYYANNVYWIEKKFREKARILYTNLKGSETIDLKIANISDWNNLAVDENYVYYSKISEAATGSRRSIVRAVKFNGTMDPDFEIINDDGRDEKNDGGTHFNGIMVLSGQTQEISERHPCALDNGHCPGYCFALPIYEMDGNTLRVCAQYYI